MIKKKFRTSSDYRTYFLEEKSRSQLYIKSLMVLGVQETKWKGDRAVDLGEGFKMLHAGGDRKTNGVGVIMNEEYTKEVIRWRDGEAGSLQCGYWEDR